MLNHKDLRVLSNLLFKSTNNDLSSSHPSSLTFRWKDKQDNFHNPHNMETRHLFFTVRMICNHSMPMKLRPYNEYRFDRFYTKEYMERTIRILIPILVEREDIKQQWLEELFAMVDWLARNQVPELKNRSIESK